MQSRQDAINNAPFNWQVVSNDGTNIVANNRVTGASFSGTLVAFNSMLTAISQAEFPTEVEALSENLLALGMLTGNVPDMAFSSTVYLFCHPTTQAGWLLGQLEMYAPLEKTGYFFGALFGTKNMSNTVRSFISSGIFKSGRFTWHGSLTKAGTWVAGSPANPAAGSFNATGATYSLTAGSTISGTIVGDIAAVRIYGTSNGGYAIVSIDGDYTKASRLPMFTNADFVAGLCRSTDVGKRYISSHFTASYNECVCLADSLGAGNHTIVFEATGTKPAASSAARFYIEGIASCYNDTFGTANVFPVPIYWIYHDYANWSANCYVAQWAPIGSADNQFLGEIHGDGTNSKEAGVSATVYVNDTDQTSIAAGVWASGTMIRFDQVSTLAHKSSLVTAIATKTRCYTFMPSRKNILQCKCSINYTTAGNILIEYPVMLPVGERINTALMTNRHFNEFMIGHVRQPMLGLNDNAVYEIQTNTKRLSASGQNIEAWVEAVDLSDNPVLSNYGGSYQDRTSLDDKAYMITVSRRTLIPANEVRKFVIGWGADLLF